MDMQILGIVLVVAAVMAAFPVHYFLNVRRTSQGGVVQVKGFLDYIFHGTLNLLATVTLGAMLLAGAYFIITG